MSHKNKAMKSQGMTGPTPPTYTCYRCGNPGHWIKNCPTFKPGVKRSTGIPRSFMVPVDGPEHKGALLTSTGAYAVPLIDHQVYEERRREEPPFAPPSEPLPEPVPQIPEEMHMIPKGLQQDSNTIPFFENVYNNDYERRNSYSHQEEYRNEYDKVHHNDRSSQGTPHSVFEGPLQNSRNICAYPNNNLHGHGSHYQTSLHSDQHAGMQQDRYRSPQQSVLTQPTVAATSYPPPSIISPPQIYPPSQPPPGATPMYRPFLGAQQPQHAAGSMLPTSQPNATNHHYSNHAYQNNDILKDLTENDERSIEERMEAFQRELERRDREQRARISRSRSRSSGRHRSRSRSFTSSKSWSRSHSRSISRTPRSRSRTPFSSRSRSRSYSYSRSRSWSKNGSYTRSRSRTRTKSRSRSRSRLELSVKKRGHSRERNASPLSFHPRSFSPKDDPALAYRTIPYDEKQIYTPTQYEGSYPSQYAPPPSILPLPDMRPPAYPPHHIQDMFDVQPNDTRHIDTYAIERSPKYPPIKDTHREHVHDLYTWECDRSIEKSDKDASKSQRKSSILSMKEETPPPQFIQKSEKVFLPYQLKPRIRTKDIVDENNSKDSYEASSHEASPVNPKVTKKTKGIVKPEQLPSADLRVTVSKERRSVHSGKDGNSRDSNQIRQSRHEIRNYSSKHSESSNASRAITLHSSKSDEKIRERNSGDSSQTRQPRHENRSYSSKSHEDNTSRAMALHSSRVEDKTRESSLRDSSQTRRSRQESKNYSSNKHHEEVNSSRAITLHSSKIEDKIKESSSREYTQASRSKHESRNYSSKHEESIMRRAITLHSSKIDDKTRESRNRVSDRRDRRCSPKQDVSLSRTSTRDSKEYSRKPSSGYKDEDSVRREERKQRYVEQESKHAKLDERIRISDQSDRKRQNTDSATDSRNRKEMTRSSDSSHRSGKYKRSRSKSFEPSDSHSLYKRRH